MSSIFITFTIIIAFSIYFFPTLFAFNRGVKNKGGIIVLNIFLGWTFLGWIIALVMAFSLQTESQFQQLTGRR